MVSSEKPIQVWYDLATEDAVERSDAVEISADGPTELL